LRHDNEAADELAKMGSTQAKIPPGVFLHQLFKPSIDLPTEEKSEDKPGAVPETIPEAVMVIHPDWTTPILEYLWHDRLPDTTTDSVNSAGHITAEIRITGSDDPSLPVLGSDNQKIIGGCENQQ
jgi:hypothetical protein